MPFGVCSGSLQLIGSAFALRADQPNRVKRCAGRLHEAFGSNMRSCRTNWCAYVQWFGISRAA